MSLWAQVLVFCSTSIEQGWRPCGSRQLNYNSCMDLFNLAREAADRFSKDTITMCRPICLKKKGSKLHLTNHNTDATRVPWIMIMPDRDQMNGCLLQACAKQHTTKTTARYWPNVTVWHQYRGRGWITPKILHCSYVVLIFGTQCEG